MKITKKRTFDITVIVSGKNREMCSVNKIRDKDCVYLDANECTNKCYCRLYNVFLKQKPSDIMKDSNFYPLRHPLCLNDFQKYDDVD